MTTLLVPAGPIYFTPREVAIILAVLAVLALLACLPVSVPFALIGVSRARAAGRSAFWDGAWMWFAGTALTLGSMWAFAASHVRYPWFVPLGWLPGFVVLGLVAVTRAHERR